jgi:hypothetical protein
MIDYSEYAHPEWDLCEIGNALRYFYHNNRSDEYRDMYSGHLAECPICHAAQLSRLEHAKNISDEFCE